MQQVILEKNQARFAIWDGNSERKIFYYFCQKDGSLGLGNYFPADVTAEKRLVGDEEWSLSIGKARLSAVPFVNKKTSFHPTGKIVSKDSTGSRIFVDPDIVSIPFSEINDPIQIRVIYPATPSSYPSTQGGDIFNVYHPTYQAPYMIKVFISPGGFNFERWMLGIDKRRDIFQDTQSLASFQLHIYTVCAPSNNKFIPEAHCEADVVF